MQDFPISRYYCMTLCQNSSIEQRRVTVARPRPPLPGYFRCRRRRRNGAVTVVITSLRGLVRQFSQPSFCLDENVIARWQPPPPSRYRRRPWRGGGGGISDPDHQVKGESLLHVLQRIGSAFFNLLLGLCWRCQAGLACRPAARTHKRARRCGGRLAFNFPMGKPPSSRWQADEFLYQEAENRPPIFR